MAVQSDAHFIDDPARSALQFNFVSDPMPTKGNFFQFLNLFFQNRRGFRCHYQDNKFQLQMVFHANQI